MPKLTVVDRSGVARTVEGTPGISVMEVMRDNGFDEVRALCGGCCSCATCHVYVDKSYADRLPLTDKMEEELLEASGHKSDTSRLSCQIQFNEALDGLKVVIAPE